MGWQPVGEDEARRPIQVNGAGVVDHQRLVRRLQSDLERLEKDLDGRDSELAGERASRDELEEAIVSLRAEVDAARAEAAESRKTANGLHAKVAEAERRAADAMAAQEMLLRARRREGDPAYLAGIALEVFNRAAELKAVVATVEAHGEPAVRVGVDGVTLPRAVRFVFSWPSGSRSYRVTCDLVARLFDVEDLAHGAGLQPPLPSFRPNARLVGGKVELV
jgi:hypothetical protein